MGEQKRAKFGSKLGMILATAGGAVGLGNVWRFPYMAGQNGGAAFILIYVGCILLLGLPCMISEFIIGRHAASNTARAYTKLSNGSAWKWVGYLGVLTGFLITGYYAVVAGWCLQYGTASVLNHLHGTPDYFKSYFADFSTNQWKPVLWTVMILLFTHYVIIHGVRNGIERTSKILMPALFVLLVAIVVASCLLPGASKGVEFLLKPDFSKVTGDVFLGALGQSFYSMSIAMGCICTYASYYSRHTKLLNSAVQIGIIDTCVAILAGLMIFPAAFSVGVSPDSGLYHFNGILSVAFNGSVDLFDFPTRGEYSLLPRGVAHQSSTCCIDRYGWLFAYRCCLFVVVGRVEFPQGGRCRPFRRLRLRDRTNLPPYWWTSYLPIYWLVCS